MDIFYDTAPRAFIIITLLLGGGAAWMTGSAVAQSWQPVSKAILYMLLLAAAVRFLQYALAGGTPPAALADARAPQLLTYFLTDFAILITIATLSHRIARASQMVAQYPWLYRRTSPISWKRKTG